MKLTTFFVENAEALSLKHQALKFALQFKFPEGLPSYADKGYFTLLDDFKLLTRRDDVKRIWKEIPEHLDGKRSYKDLFVPARNYLYNRTTLEFDIVGKLLYSAVSLPVFATYYTLKFLTAILFSPYLIASIGFAKAFPAIWRPLDNLTGLAFRAITIVPEFLYSVGLKTGTAIATALGKRSANSFAHDEPADSPKEAVTVELAKTPQATRDELRESRSRNMDELLDARLETQAIHMGVQSDPTL